MAESRGIDGHETPAEVEAIGQSQRPERERASEPEDVAPGRFIVLCAARTGSAMLSRMLGSHPEISSRGELLAAPKGRLGRQLRVDAETEERLIEVRAADPGRFLTDNVYSRALSGFKIKYEELSRPEFSKALDWLVGERSIKVIHLFRRNRLKRFVSQRTVRVHGSYEFVGDLPAPPRFSLSVEDCLADFHKQEGREIRFRGLFREHRVLEVQYEDLPLARIQEWLGVEPAALESRTLKINPERVSEIVTNYAELKEAFRGTPHAAYFDE